MLRSKDGGALANAPPVGKFLNAYKCGPDQRPLCEARLFHDEGFPPYSGFPPAFGRSIPGRTKPMPLIGLVASFFSVSWMR